MYKVCLLLESPDQASAEDPFTYRGAKAAEAVGRVVRDVRGFVQTRALPAPEKPAFCGVIELWFEGQSSALGACRADFSDLLKPGVTVQSVFAGIERVVLRTTDYLNGRRIKGVYPFCKRADMSLNAFKQHWWHTHGPIAARTEEALSYHQIHPVAEMRAEHSPNYDGITEIAWPDVEAAGRALASRQMREDQGSDAPNFVDMDSIALVLAEEEIVLAP